MSVPSDGVRGGIKFSHVSIHHHLMSPDSEDTILYGHRCELVTNCDQFTPIKAYGWFYTQQIVKRCANFDEKFNI